MAEIRKYNPASNAIRDAVAKAMGEPVRPNTPGAPAAKSAPSTAPAPRADVFSSSTQGFTVPAPRKAEEPD